MRCKVCNSKNLKGSRFCCSCGAELCRAHTEGIKPAASAEASERRARAVIALLTAAVLIVIFGATALILHGIRNKGGKHDAVIAASELPTQAATPSPVPTATVLPIELIHTPRPTAVPTHTPGPTVPPIEFLKPTPRPTEEPAETPLPTETPTPDGGEDLAPIDAVCSFILYGDAKYARLAFPPEYITYTVSNYGFVAQLLGSEDAVIKYAGGMILAGFKAKYGEVSAIEHTLVHRHKLSEPELFTLCGRLDDYGMTAMPEDAHLLTVDLVITASNGTFRERIYPHVLLIDGVWYIDPEDIDF